MYVGVQKYVHTYVNERMHVHKFVYEHNYVRLCMYVCVCGRTYVRIRVQMYIYILYVNVRCVHTDVQCTYLLTLLKKRLKERRHKRRQIASDNI